MPIGWNEGVTFLRSALTAAVTTELSQVRYGDAPLAFSLGVLVAIVLGMTVARLVLVHRRHSRLHSGHIIERRFRKGLSMQLLHAMPKLLLAAAVALLLVAVADPFLTTTDEVTGLVESRVRVDLVDVSGSMGLEFPGTGKSKAAVAREAHLKFIDMRRGKDDRVSLWLFSSYPYMVDDFVIDDDLYYFQVYDAPYVMSRWITPSMKLPSDKVRRIPVEGTTNIVRPLQAIIKYFDSDEVSAGRRHARQRAVLIITDAAVDELPDQEFAELNDRNIIPYIIYINTGDGRTVGQAERRLVQMIREHGGDYFDVIDLDSLQRAYEAIDAREAVGVEIRHRVLRVPIYSRFLLVGMVFLIVGIPAGFVAELLWGTRP